MGERPTLRLSAGLRALYEDRDLIVVDKPSGLLTIASGSERERTAHWILCEALRRRGEKRRVAVVHRLDRDTSGVLVFGKSDSVKRAFMEDWEDRVLERTYVALAEGNFPEELGRIEASLGEDRGGRMVVVPEGTRGALPAATRWRVLETGRGYTLVELELETGRRNQIRAHLHWVGRPVAGDGKYGAETDPLGRLALHAERLVFTHPMDGRRMEFTVPAPDSFRQALVSSVAQKRISHRFHR